MEKKSRSLILKEAKELRQKYYFYKQKLVDFIKLFEEYKDRLISRYFEREGIEGDNIKLYFDGLSIIKLKTKRLAQLKAEVDKLPHIPNKQERKVIRQFKQKANVHK